MTAPTATPAATAATERRRSRWVLVLAVILLGASLVRGEQVQDSAERSAAASSRAEAAAAKASADLADAIAASDNPEQAAQLAEAFRALFQTRDVLCAVFPDECAEVAG